MSEDILQDEISESDVIQLEENSNASNTDVQSANQGEKLYKCFTCDSKFVHPKTLIQHIISAHVGDKPQTNVRQKHGISIHDENKSFKSSNCSQPFSSKSTLNEMEKPISMQDLDLPSNRGDKLE